MASRPDRAFRIADVRRTIFDGTGAFLHGGRWNSPGARVIYASETFTGAMLEVLVRTRLGRIPRQHCWIEIAIPSDVSIEILEPSDVIGWEGNDSSIARSAGDRWYKERKSLILIAPSVVAAGMARNVLINQEHPMFQKLRPTDPRPVIWDERLFHR